MKFTETSTGNVTPITAARSAKPVDSENEAAQAGRETTMTKTPTPDSASTLTLLEGSGTPADLAIHNVTSMMLALVALTEDERCYHGNYTAVTGLIAAAHATAKELPDRIVGVP